MSQFQALVDPSLPWDPYPGENRRFGVLMILMLILALLIVLLVKFIKIPEIDRAKAEALPEHLATVVLEQKQVPPPPPPKPVEKKEEVKAETKQEEKPKPQEKAPEVEHTPKPVQMDAKTQAARAKAKQEIQNAGFDELASLRDMDMSTVAPKTTGLPGQTGAGTGGLITSTEAAGTSRNMLTSRAGGYSGATAAYSGGVSSGFGGGVAGGKGSKGGSNGYGLSGGQVSGVKSTIVAEGQSVAREKNKDGKSRRSVEDLRRVFDQYGGKITNAYQRALRDDPSMQGSVNLRLAIAPEGNVTSCSVSSSELNNPELEGKLCVIVKGFNFGEGDFEPYNGPYKLNLIPN